MSQVESTEGEKGWKEVEDKPASKHPGFSQVCPYTRIGIISQVFKGGGVLLSFCPGKRA